MIDYSKDPEQLNLFSEEKTDEDKRIEWYHANKDKVKGGAPCFNKECDPIFGFEAYMESCNVINCEYRK